MRADRLVAELLILQARGRVTAAELADELEISERTARRDLEALAIAGIPVYSQPGRGGGWSLVGGARTDLTGLTAAEARTLFLVAGPSSAVTPQVRLGYTDARGAVSDRVVHPLGLVSKGTTWYLVADTDAGLRTFRVWRVRSVGLLDEPPPRPH